MRILFISAVGGLGGAERCLLTAMTAVRSSGHDVRLISCTDGPLIAQAAQCDIPAQVLPMPAALAASGESGGIVRTLLRGLVVGPMSWRYARRMRRAIAEIAPDLIHSNGLKVHVLLGMARPTAPVVWHLHDFLGSRRLMGKVLRRAARRASRAIAISNAVRQDATAVLTPLPIDVVMNAVDVDRFSPAPADGNALDQLAGLPPATPGTVRIGLIATYARWKGQDLFLRAAARVVRENPATRARFYIIGGAIYHTKGSQWSPGELVAMAAELGLAGHVGFIPFQAEPADIYRALDIVVHASTSPEPFGLTIVEAMACGRPVIVSRAGGAAEIFADGIDAIGFTPGNETELSRKMVQLADDAPRRRTIGQAARSTTAQRFSDARLGLELVQVYQRAQAR